MQGKSTPASLLYRLVQWWATRNGMMLVPASRFSPEVIRRTRKALKNDAAGNRGCTMTDLDLACDMLDEMNYPTTTLRRRIRLIRNEIQASKNS
jgi:hypothetical protein